MLTLSTDHVEVFTYFGFDATAFDVGFHDEEHIWKWCISSPYFDIYMFQRSIDLLADDSVECDKANMRTAYRRFLLWVATNAADLHFKSQLPSPTAYFEKEDTLRCLLDRHNRRIERKKKYSGRLFVEMGITKGNIGIAMKWVKSYFDRSNACRSMDDWIDDSSADEITQWVESAIKLYKAEASGANIDAL